MLPDFLPAAEVLAKGVKHVACYVADAITERRNGFSDDEAGDYLACAGADALAETFPTSAVNPHTADDPAAGSSPLPAAGSLTFDELPTSELLNRAATTLLVSAACISLAGWADAVPTDDVDRFTTKLRDRATQLAAHGD